MAFMVAQVVGCVNPVASPVVVERGGMPWDLSSLLAQLIEALFLVKEITHSALHITFKQGA